MSSPSDWWRTFFTGVVLDTWRAAVTPQQTKAEADFLQRILKVPPRGQILDVPCGNGRLALELASRGFRTTGVDLALPFIEEGKTRAAREGLSAELQQRDMRDLPWTNQFDGAFCCGNSFGYLDDEGNAAFLQAVCRTLKPKASFLIQFGTLAESILPTFQERRWYQMGEIYFLVYNRYDPARGRLETEYTFIREGRVEKRQGSQRVYTYRELCQLLGEAGFTDCEGFDYSGGEPFKLGSPGVSLVARKRAD
jgi:SAM-dependent methyltransferase